MLSIFLFAPNSLVGLFPFKTSTLFDSKKSNLEKIHEKLHEKIHEKIHEKLHEKLLIGRYRETDDLISHDRMSVRCGTIV